MNQYYYGIPAHLMPDTALYVPIVIYDEGHSCVTHPDLGRVNQPNHLNQKGIYLASQSVDKKSLIATNQSHTRG